LHDGRVVRARAIRPDDTDRLREFHTHLSLDSIIFRYFHLVPTLSQDQAEHLTHLDYADRMALVATVGSGAQEQIIGVVRYERLAPTSAEVAFLVRDDYQHRGIATGLFHLLADYARALGIRTFLAEIMPSNLHMRDMLRHAGYPYLVRYEEDCVEMRVDISLPLDARAA
jgi:RimJ/RimL family protein N-acetyltransferase